MEALPYELRALEAALLMVLQVLQHEVAYLESVTHPGAIARPPAAVPAAEHPPACTREFAGVAHRKMGPARACLWLCAAAAGHAMPGVLLGGTPVYAMPGSTLLACALHPTHTIARSAGAHPAQRHAPRPGAGKHNTLVNACETCFTYSFFNVFLFFAAVRDPEPAGQDSG